MITVILNCYRRLKYLEEQIRAIENQTVKPNDIWIWYNNPGDRQQADLNAIFGDKYKIIQSNYNFKFHARFALAFLASTEYVAFFDDDTIPGSKWFENCLDTMAFAKNAILGCSGIKLKSNQSYRSYTKVGWNGVKGSKAIEVDLVGHAWFFRKELLSCMFQEEPYSWENGEDIQLSFLSYMTAGIKTFVPPHPKDDQEMWGSIKGQEFGGDSEASCKKGGHYALRDDIVRHYVKNGYTPVKFRL